MRRIIRPIVIIISVMMISSFGFEDGNNLPYQIATIDSKKLDGNNISTWFRNNGSFNRNPVTGNSGFEFPKGSSMFVRYASGLTIGAVVDDDTLIAIAEYDYEYLPGYVDNNGMPQGRFDSEYIVYKIIKGDSINEDYLNWPANQGAYLNSNGKPRLIGNQTMFYSYTDAYPESHGNNAGGTAPLKAQILQTNWCLTTTPGSPLNNIVYSEFRIINRSYKTWNKCYLSIWNDDDIGVVASDDALGVDSNFNFTYSYNFDNNDPGYGNTPPAVGTIHLRGPIVSSPGDTVRYYYPPGSNNLVTKPGYKELGLSSFNPYINADPIHGDPANYKETYLYLQGLRRNGGNWINPFTGNATYFPYDAWQMTNSGNTKSFESIGPLTIAPGDTQTITIAQVVARGTSNLNSLTHLRPTANLAKLYFDHNFNITLEAPSPGTSFYSPGNQKIYLSWNDTAEKISIPNILSGGIYRFQGYNIYQIKSYSAEPQKKDTVLIMTFDIRDDIRDIYDSLYLPEYNGIVYGIVQRGYNNGISRYFVVENDSISNGHFINGTEYKFAVTAYYYDPSGGIASFPKVLESPKNIIKVIPQNISPSVQLSYGLGDTIYTDQKDLAVMPVVIDPLQLITANYSSVFGGTNTNPNWTVTRTANGITTTLYEDVYNFNGQQDTVKRADGLLFIHQFIRDSGIVRDPDDVLRVANNIPTYSRQRAWTYEPDGKEWFTAPDTNSINSSIAKVISGRQFESRSLGMSFPTQGTFKNQTTRIKANGIKFTPGTGTNTTLTGGPLRKIQFVFGESSKAYRYVPTDSNLNNTPFADMVSVPYKVFAVDELDSSGGAPRQLNVAFVDTDNSGSWNPNTSDLGGYEFTFIFASSYSETPNSQYTSRNILLASPASGFPGFDIMYAWLPRIKSINGIPQQWSNGDKLTVWPYRITRPEFVPGYPVKYSWTVNGTQFNNTQNAMAEIQNIKAFPNPYYGFSELEYNDAGEKFIYFSHLPAVCDIFIYTLDGVLAKKIQRNNNDPNNSLEKWDLKNNSGSNVASGMYLVYVDCKELGTKVLKIAVFQNKF